MKKLFAPVVVSVVLLMGTGCGTRPHAEALAPARDAAVICPVAAALEAQTMAAAPKCVASTVGLFIDSQPPGTGSGVVVSADGLILTVGHVVEKAGVPLTIRFADGRVAQGVTLAADIEADTGMARITDEAPAGGWPFSPMAPADSARPGEWVLAAGHPGGIVGDRNPPLRLGRVTGHDKQLIHTDCAIEPGDSGGPLFDLTGRVVGVGSSIILDDNKRSLAENITVHIPVSLYASQWKDLLAGNVRRARRGRLAAGGEGERRGSAWSDIEGERAGRRSKSASPRDAGAGQDVPGGAGPVRPCAGRRRPMRGRGAIPQQAHPDGHHRGCRRMDRDQGQ